jgi:DNA-binding transcriptional ArsR family regulator
MTTLISHLLGDTRTAVLAALLLRPDEPQHVRELARATGVSPGTVHRELTALAKHGVLTRKVVGRQVYFTANRDCPVFEELAGLVRKTAGSVDVIRHSLSMYTDRIKAAFVYGSVAAGKETSGSDVDVMILGDVSFTEAVQALAPAQAALRREINPTVMKPDEFLRKRDARDGFVSTVWNGPRLWITGDEHELG